MARALNAHAHRPSTFCLYILISSTVQYLSISSATRLLLVVKPTRLHIALDGRCTRLEFERAGHAVGYLVG